VHRVDPELPIFQSGSLESIISDSFNQRRGAMLLLGCFAGLALVLSAVGISGVLACDVAQRTREIGIRGALGATRGQIVALILQQGLMKTALGLALGLSIAVVLSRYMTSLLYDVQAHDPVSYVVVSILLLAVALFASYLPARRAAKVDPVETLRAE
jgi:ABC-type antimicrobial peptide transport system permease subunit